MNSIQHNREEIEERLRRGYLDRLSLQIQRLRRHLVDRNWEKIRTECRQLSATGESFGFHGLTRLAFETKKTIPEGRVLSARTPLQARENTEALIAEVDQILVEYRLQPPPLNQGLPQKKAPPQDQKLSG